MGTRDKDKVFVYKEIIFREEKTDKKATSY